MKGVTGSTQINFMKELKLIVKERGIERTTEKVYRSMYEKNNVESL